MLALILHETGHADRHGLELGMVDVGGDDHASAGNFVAHELGRELFFVGDVAHFFSDYALARVVHLRKIAGRVFLLAAGEPLGAGLRGAVSVAAIAVAICVAIAGSHDRNATFSMSQDYNRVDGVGPGFRVPNLPR